MIAAISLGHSLPVALIGHIKKCLSSLPLIPSVLLKDIELYLFLCKQLGE